MPLEGDAWVFTAKNPWAQVVERDQLRRAAAFQQGFSSDVGESTGSISASSIRGKVKTWLDILSHCSLLKDIGHDPLNPLPPKFPHFFPFSIPFTVSDISIAPLAA